MGKHKQHQSMQQQLILEEYQETTPTVVIRVEASYPDTDEDLGSLPGCLGFHNQPEQGYECSTCYHQTLCKETTNANR